MSGGSGNCAISWRRAGGKKVQRDPGGSHPRSFRNSWSALLSTTTAFAAAAASFSASATTCTLSSFLEAIKYCGKSAK